MIEIIAGINITFIYVVLAYVLIIVGMKEYSKVVKEPLFELENKNKILQNKIRSLMFTGRVELFEAQRELYSNLFKMVLIGLGKISILILVFTVIMFLPFDIQAPMQLPCFLDFTTFEFVNSVSPAIAMLNIFLLSITFQLALYIYKTIIYYTKSKEVIDYECEGYPKYNERDGEK
jgi:hypothetical protein